MSSDRPSDAPSRPADVEPGAPAATAIAERGAPLLEGLEAHLPGARRHADGTAAYAFAAAVELGQERERAEAIRETARLHDVGLVYVPAPILGRPAEELADAQRAQLEWHLEAAYGLCRGAGIDERACAWILRTRERHDGGGPEGLRGMRIPIESRIIRTACAADLLLTRAGAEATVQALRASSGAELDPAVSNAIVAVVELAAARMARP
jgi:HD-GYP domain-containing protein (c-di-GMP phosphodiesterase class II)